MGKGGLLAELKVSARGAEVCWDSYQGQKHWWTPSLQSLSAFLALTLAVPFLHLILTTLQWQVNNEEIKGEIKKKLRQMKMET